MKNKHWVGIRDSEGNLLGAVVREGKTVTLNKQSDIQVDIKGRSRLAVFDPSLGQSTFYSVYMESGVTPPDLDIIFVGKCIDGQLAFKTADGVIISLKNSKPVRVSEGNLPSALNKKVIFEEVGKGVFEFKKK
jgi:hypothetical protein